MTEIRMKVKPWTVPNFVVIEGVEKSIPLADAPHDVVRQLMQELMSDIYKKAGMSPDWRFE